MAKPNSIGYRRPKKSAINQQGEKPGPKTRSRMLRLRRKVGAYKEDVVEIAADDDVAIDVDAEESDEDCTVLNMNRAIRITICCMFQKDYNKLTNDVVEDIRKRTRLSRWYNIKGVIEEYLVCKAGGTQYEGRRVVMEGAKLGRPPILDVDGVEAQLVADSIENGVSPKLTHLIINTHRQQEGLPSVTFAAVYSLVKRLQPVSQKLVVHCQGSYDAGTPWAKARLAWGIQLLIRYGIVDFDPSNPIKVVGLDDVLDDYYTNPIPDYFNKTKLDAISPFQQADWDEAHRECCPGEGLGNPKRTTRLIFPRDPSGKIDLVNGKYTEEHVTMMRVKYNEEMRKSFGVAMVKPLDAEGNELPTVGRRLKDFDYTGKVIKSIKDWTYLVKREIDRVKKLSNPTQGGWLVKARVEGKVYADDDLTAVKGIGGTIADKLKEQDVTDVFRLTQLTMTEISNISANIRGMSEEKLHGFVGYAMDNYVDSNAPQDIDYRDTPHPYKARYGDEWEEKMESCGTLSNYCCVTKLVTHIYEETKRCFQDTKYKDNFVFYHDALSLMTDKECRQWMQEQGYLKHWILPQQKLFYDDKDLGRYRDRPVGNSPELNALDNSLNKDVHEVVNKNVALTLSVEGGDENFKFSLRTPLEAASTYSKVFAQLAPTEKRIIQDRTNIINSLKWIVKYSGAVVPDSELALDFETGKAIRSATPLRNGHRDVNSNSAEKKRGGKRKRKLAEDDYGSTATIHPAALKVTAANVEASKYLFGDSNSKAVEAMEGIKFKKKVLAAVGITTSDANSPSSSTPNIT